MVAWSSDELRRAFDELGGYDARFKMMDAMGVDMQMTMPPHRPVADAEMVEAELMLADLHTLDTALPKAERTAKSGDKDAADKKAEACTAGSVVEAAGMVRSSQVRRRVGDAGSKDPL